VRVPNTFSFRASEFERVDETVRVLPLHTMSDREAGDFIRRCAAALHSYGSGYYERHDKENAWPRSNPRWPCFWMSETFIPMTYGYRQHSGQKTAI